MNDKPTIGVVIGTGAGALRALAGDSPAKITDPITAPAIVSGPHGKAWQADTAAGLQRMQVKAGDDASLAHWVIEAPWAHPAWHSYSLIVVHLRPLPRGGSTLFYLDGATHEIWLHALDPEKDRNRLLTTGIPTGCFLTPKNFAAQFIEITDDLARERVRSAVQEICDGRLSPDTDHQRAWADRFGNNMMKDRPNARPPIVRSDADV